MTATTHNNPNQKDASTSQGQARQSSGAQSAHYAASGAASAHAHPTPGSVAGQSAAGAGGSKSKSSGGGGQADSNGSGFEGEGVGQELKSLLTKLEHAVSASLPDSRAQKLAKTKLEECWMWLKKAISDHASEGNE